MSGPAHGMTVRAAGDTLWLIELGDTVSLELNARVIATAGAIRAARVAGVHDVVPAYASIGVHVDPLHVDGAALERAINHAVGQSPEVAQRADARGVVEIPVCYGGEYGPDLEEVATFAGCTPDDVVRRHTAETYHVYMLGFLPGFGYLGSVDPTIAIPRRISPRARVPAGSVGIAGRQTGVYPSESPGGWRLIGRTPWRMFDLQRAVPAVLRAGDQVRFVPVPASAWDAHGSGPERT